MCLLSGARRSPLLSFDEDADAQDLKLYLLMKSSILFDTINLGWSIVQCIYQGITCYNYQIVL